MDPPQLIFRDAGQNHIRQVAATPSIRFSHHQQYVFNLCDIKEPISVFRVCVHLSKWRLVGLAKRKIGTQTMVNAFMRSAKCLCGAFIAILEMFDNLNSAFFIGNCSMKITSSPPRYLHRKLFTGQKHKHQAIGTAAIQIVTTIMKSIVLWLASFQCTGQGMHLKSMMEQ